MTTALLDAPATISTICTGSAILGDGSAQGRCAIRRTGQPAIDIPVGSILVVDKIDASLLPLVVDASAVVVEADPARSGLADGHLGAILHSLDIPLICSATGATAVLAEGDWITATGDGPRVRIWHRD